MMMPPPDNILYAIARSCVFDPNLWDDCVQEGRIAYWQATRKNPGQTEAWYRQAAKWRMMDVARTNWWLGSPASSARAADPLRRYDTARYGSQDFGYQEDPDPQPEEACLDLEAQTEMLALVSKLPERMKEVVYKKFYCSMTPTEICNDLGLTLGSVSSSISGALDILSEYVGGPRKRRKRSVK